MANPEHVKMLRELDAGEWNIWREQNPEIQINLEHAELQDSNLSYKNLSNADFRASPSNKVIAPAEQKAKDLENR